MHAGFWWVKPEGKSYMEDLDIDGRILNWIVKKQDGDAWTGLLWLGIGTSGGLL
jgi:hypothetical protein